MVATNYTPPKQLQGQTVDVVHRRMLSILPSDLDKQRGGGSWDLTRPAATEAALFCNDINVALQIMFPQFAYDEWLDYHAEAVGLARRPANPSFGYVNVTGAVGTNIPEGFLFATPSIDDEPNLEFAVTVATAIGAGGAAKISVNCTVGGAIGNVDQNSITLMVSPITGIDSVTNAQPLTGGTDAEGDESLRARIAQRDQGGDASFVGSIADYTRWALEVPGVGGVIVVPEWQGPGTGTVKLILVDSNGQPANDAILNAVYNHIMSPNDDQKRLAPIGAILTVVAPGVANIVIAATLTLAADALLDTVKAGYLDALNTYFVTAGTEEVVRYSQVGRILAETAGVIDYTDLTLNGGTSNIAMTEGEYPVADIDGLVTA